MHRQTLAQNFFSLTKQKPSLCISTCSLGSGGCYTFGENLARTLNHDYITLTHDSIKKSFFNNSSAKPPYENVYITGCEFDQPELLKKILEKFDFSKLTDVFLIAPPQSYISNYEKASYTLNEKFINATHHSIKLLTSSVDNENEYSIGLPKHEMKLLKDEKLLEIHTLGIIYIRDLITKSHNEDEAILFLKKYFKQIKKLAQNEGIANPSVLIIPQDETKKSLYESCASSYGITLLYKDRMPQDQFHSAIKEINIKNGIIACNGIQTFIEASLCDCNILFYANKHNNENFLLDILDQIPISYRAAAEEILGLSNNLNINIEQLKNVHAMIKKIFQDSNNRFETLRLATEVRRHPPSKEHTSESINMAIEKLKLMTHAEWEYDNKRHTFCYVGEISKIVFENLRKKICITKNPPPYLVTLFCKDALYTIDETPEVIINLSNATSQKFHQKINTQ